MTEEELSDAKYYLDVIEHRFAELLPSFDEKGEISRHISEQGGLTLSLFINYDVLTNLILRFSNAG